jgi:RimJ/RimL family protein N-acetyltransferase
MDNSDTDIQLLNVSKAWANPLWELWNDHIDDIPKTWPKTQSEFSDWVLARNTPETYPTTCMILVPVDGEYEIAGVISADLVNPDNYTKYEGAPIGDVNISYMTFNEFRGRRLAAEAVQLFTQAILADGRFPVLRIAPHNTPSRNVAEQCGFHVVERIEPDDPCQFVDRAKLVVYRHPSDPFAHSKVRNVVTRDDHQKGGLFGGFARGMS